MSIPAWVRRTLVVSAWGCMIGAAFFVVTGDTIFMAIALVGFWGLAFTIGWIWGEWGE